jgi:endonuclease G
MLLSFLQAIALLLIAALVGEVVLWSDLTRNIFVSGGLITALLAYAGLLSWVFLGDREAWPKWAFAWAWQKLFSTPRRLYAVCGLLSLAVVGWAFPVSLAWPVWLTGIISFDQEPVSEEVAVTIRTATRDSVSLTTKVSRFDLPLSRKEAGESVFITAESKNFRTAELVEAKPGTVLLPLVRRQTLLVEVSRSDDPQFHPQGLAVVAREAAPDARPIQTITDDEGIAYFEAAKGSRWRITIVADKTYTSPFFSIEDVPFSFSADVSRPNYWVEEERIASTDVTAIPLHTESISPQIVREFASASQRIELANVPNFDPSLLGWAPPAARLLVRKGFIVSYNDAFKIPYWVAYTIEGERNDWARTDIFVQDPDLPPEIAATNTDYRGSGYDRGNLVTLSDMRYKALDAYKQAYYLSSFCPQTPDLNRKVWMKIEALARAALPSFGKIYIFAGPAFVQDNGADKPLTIPFIGSGRVAVPTHFFRIHVAIVNGKLNVLSFLVPNQQALDPDITKYLVSVDRIEAVTGLTFFGSLPESERVAIKSATPTALWQ